MEKCNFTIAGKKYSSRLLVGTGKYKDFHETQSAIENSGAEIVTVAIRRTNIGQDKNEPNILDFLKLIVANPYIKNEILNIYNIEITDLDSNNIPDTKEQIHTILNYINENGIGLNDSTLLFNSDRIKENVYYNPSTSDEVVTFLTIRIPGSREQSSINKAHNSITSKLNSLDDSGYFTEIGLTGSPFTRKAQLDASTDTLRTSLPIAVTATFILLLITMKSFRYAFATIIPIILVVTWLYGLMYLLGFSLNFVTAMIGAISIGIGIDYSIHIDLFHTIQFHMKYLHR